MHLQQPSISGISTLLTFLKTNPGNANSAPCIWFSAREEPIVYINKMPFVLRDSDAPLSNIKRYQGINAARLEAMEDRLKTDVINEAKRFDGLLVVHDELDFQNSGDDIRVVPTWTSVDDIQTPREVFDDFRNRGYKVRYIRIPISPEQAPDDRYLDEYVDVIKSTNPNENLVFNCGMGVGRTTFAMVVAIVIRRKQLLAQGKEDPILVRTSAHKSSQPDLFHIEEAESPNQAMLRLVFILENGLSNKKEPQSAITWALARGPLIEDLKTALLGNYKLITQLTSVLPSGAYSKRLLDKIINQSDTLINLREVILLHRLKYSTTGDIASLARAQGCLERYFFLLAFCAYVNEWTASSLSLSIPSSSSNEQHVVFTQGPSFRDWLEARAEIWRMLQNLRARGARLFLFRPVEDLSIFAETDKKSYLPAWNREPGMPIASELENFVIKSRQGDVLSARTILKVDFWGKDFINAADKIDRISGASNFRKIAGFPIYGVAQPTIRGIRNSIQVLTEDLRYHLPSKIIWINLQPLIYINDTPYVLRDQYFTLRNINSYSGITPSRLEVIESRLKEDVIQELEAHDDKILIHKELNSSTIPMWEDCSAENVKTISEVMETLQLEGTNIEYFRVPVTAEQAPDDADFDYLLSLLTRRSENDTAIVVNCQVGLGRSTTGTVISTLIYKWLHGKKLGDSEDSPVGDYESVVNHKFIASMEMETFLPPKSPHASCKLQRMNYTIINTLLRVVRNGLTHDVLIRKGLESKLVVDNVIDQCGQVLNIRDSIEICRLSAERMPEDVHAATKVISSSSPEPGIKDSIDPITLQRKRTIRRGILHLKRYFMMIAFQCFLNQTSIDLFDAEKLKFKEWMDSHSEFSLMLEEMENGGIESLVPVEYMSAGDGIALTTEVVDVVNRRNGGVLARLTILKYDMFPGAQKLSLMERIDGAPNYRGISVSSLRKLVGEGGTPPVNMASGGSQINQCNPKIYGIGMPTKDAVLKTLVKTGIVKGSKEKKLYWTSLREEPVIYVKGRPYVLRLFQDPVKNLEATGIARERVEMMEERMKLDVISELRTYNGRILLHDEEGDMNSFSIVPVWETVREDEVLTPLDIYSSIVAEGYNVDYLRIPITDEQAPIPGVFDELVERLSNLDDNADVIFNCQMGFVDMSFNVIARRGRTTTGMISICLMEMIMGNTLILKEVESSQNILDSIDTPVGSSSSHQHFLQGEYRIILQLIAVLQFGKQAKNLTDKAIDACNHVQNLRLAIYDYKLRVDACELGSRKHSSILGIAINYLVRYFYLIVFADYLLQETTLMKRRGRSDQSGERQSKPPQFSAWLEERREIKNIVLKMNQTLE